MNSIFRYFIPHEGDDKETLKLRQGYASWFIDSFPISEFQGEEYIFWYFLKYATRLEVSLKPRYFEVFLNSRLRELLLKDNVRVEGTEALNPQDINQIETMVEITKEVMLSSYDLLLREEEYIEDFVADMDEFMTMQIEESAMLAISRSIEMQKSIVDGQIGPTAAIEDLNASTALIMDIYDKEKLEELGPSVMRKEEFKFITDTGIPAIDKDMLGAYSGQMIGIEAAGGTGKTRFAIGVWAWRAAVINKKSVVYYAMEQSEAEVESMLLARHILHLYGKQIVSQLISKKLVPEKLQPIVDAARDDLFESGKYGKIHICTDYLYLESFKQKLDRLDKLKGPFDVIVIDYMALIEQRNTDKDRDKKVFVKSLSDWEVTKKAYRYSKKYARRRGKLVIAINQLTKEGADKAKEGKDTGMGDVQGGMEAYRSCDYNLVLAATPEMESQNKIRIFNPKKRDTAGLGNLLLNVRLGVCLFMQDQNKTL